MIRIGFALKQLIHERYGIASCSACLELASELDRLTPEAVRDNLDGFAARMHQNASQHPSLFARLLDDVAYAVSGVAGYRKVLEEAIAIAERRGEDHRASAATRTAVKLGGRPGLATEYTEPDPHPILRRVRQKAALWKEQLRNGRPRGLVLSSSRSEVIDVATLAGDPVVIDATQHGLGDAMITAWISEGSKGERRRLLHHATGAKAEVLRLFGQEVLETPVSIMSDTFETYKEEQRNVQNGVDTPGYCVAHRARYLGIASLPKRPTITALSPEAVEWSQSACHDRPVLLFPQVAYGSRAWPVSYWLSLIGLLKAAGVPSRVMLADDDPAFTSVRPDIGLGWDMVIAAMQRSRLVVGNDSGPAHVAGTLDVPTLALLGPTTTAWVFGHVPSVRGLAASDSVVSCVGCCYRADRWRPGCEHGCEALLQLRPDEVARMALSLCTRKEADRDL